MRLTETMARRARDARARWDETRRMRLPDAAHTAQPWAIHSLAPDFELEDVWALPTPGGPDDLATLVAMVAGGEQGGGSRAARALFAIRWKLGELLGWDAAPATGGDRTPSLRDRFGPELRAAPRGPAVHGSPFAPLYLLEREYAAEIANATMHGVLHVGWVADGDGAYRAQMAVLVKPNGAFGRTYMAAIRPFRYLIVYPPMIRQIGRAWAARGPRAASTGAAVTAPVAGGRALAGPAPNLR
jgi:hypothetical protein